MLQALYFLLHRYYYFGFHLNTRKKINRKAYYFPHNNKLELIWTAVPAIFLTVLVVFGLKYWFKFTGDAPKDAQLVEVTGHQFGWEFRYPGKDKVLGKKNYKLTDAAHSNPLGVDLNDPASHDDIHVAATMHITGWQTCKTCYQFTGCNT